MVVQGSGCALQGGTWVPLWEKGCCLLSVQVAEKHAWCVWQWCVCVCVGGYIRECTGWGDTTRECQLLNFKFCEQGGFCSVLYRLVSNRDQPSRRASKELATGWSLRGP